MKRLLSIFLAVVLVMSLAVTAFAAESSATVSASSAELPYNADADQQVTITYTVSGAFTTYEMVVSAEAPITIASISGIVGNPATGAVAYATDSNIESHSFTVTYNVPAGTAGTYAVSADVDYVSDADLDDAAVSVAAGAIVIEAPVVEHVHAWGEWEVTTPATCTEAGVETRTCANADCPIGTETREIPALGHTWGEWEVTKEATCVEAGVETRTCSVCGETETREIAMVDHNYGAWTFCGTDAKHEHEKVCSVCGDKVVADCNDQLQYTDEEKVEGGKNVTEYWQCADCGHEFSNTKFVEDPKEPVVDPDLDDVPRTDDITGQVVMAGAAALVAMMAAVAFVFKRKAAK